MDREFLTTANVQLVIVYDYSLLLIATSATGHHLQTVQTIVENVYVWSTGPRRPVSEC